MQEIVARSGTGQGMMGGGFETVSHPLRTPSIEKPEEILGKGAECAQQIVRDQAGVSALSA